MTIQEKIQKIVDEHTQLVIRNQQITQEQLQLNEQRLRLEGKIILLQQMLEEEQAL